MSPQKTLFIVCFHPLVSRNILSAPFFELLKKNSGLKIVLIVHEKKKDFFDKNYGGGNVVVEGVKRNLNELDYLFKDLAAAAIRTRSRKLIRKMRLGHERWNAYKIFFWAPLIRPLIPKLFSLIVPRNRYAFLFEKYTPALLLTTDVFNPMDVILAHEAKHRGVKVLGMVRSWDNLTAKGGFRVVPDELIVNNEIIKQDAIKIHGVSDRVIKIVGIPHYDKYLDGSPLTREELYKRLGIGLDRKFIVYAPVGNRFFTRNTFDREMVLIIREMLPDGFHLIVRCPPGDPVDLEGVSKDPRIIIDQPGTRFSGSGERQMDTEMSPADDDWLVSVLYHSELLISGFTTLTVDAARFNKPVIVVGFDAKTPLPYRESVKRHLEFEHFQPILKSGGVRIAHSETELKNLFALYLRNPETDGEKRKAMVMKQAYKLDGKGSERLLECIVTALEINSNRSDV
ncbi:MAG: hypothetical protein UX94_C0004G0016 [Parcubacteria group bacterium GW2011_GWA2_47_21]|nr:MAG: hypothetical protein UX94_C0004G0016 [Parcubacteria group bacterium GW2011_GWA2_47_21]